ncbi:hypothetical protein ACHAW5_003473 [Stephanodiscus triporus]|uniref:Uncharacterized protein n=1 Tax=Stephanodiscus triporus TaxID=2934178 RepID=A0ABD3ML23_9STRA
MALMLYILQSRFTNGIEGGGGGGAMGGGENDGYQAVPETDDLDDSDDPLPKKLSV